MTRPKPGFDCMRFLSLITLLMTLFYPIHYKSLYLYLGKPKVQKDLLKKTKKKFHTFLSMGKNNFLIGKLINFREKN